MALATPIMLLLLFGYALTLDVDHVPLAVWDQSRTPRSREFISRFDGSRYFDRRLTIDNYHDLVHAIDTREVMMGLVVPRDFAQNIAAGRDAAVQLIVNGSDSNTATIAIGYAQTIAADLRAGPCRRAGQRPRRRTPVQIPLDVRPRVWFNEELESRNFIIPGLIAVIMMVIAAMLTSLTIAREWERGTMEQLISTPITPGELITGKLVPYFVVGMCDVLLAVLMAQFVFHVPLRGNVAIAVRHLDDLPHRHAGHGAFDQHRHQEPIGVEPDRRGRHLPPGLSALGLRVHDLQYAEGHSNHHTHRAGAVFRGHPEGHLPEGRGLGNHRRPSRLSGDLRPHHGDVGKSKTEKEVDVIVRCQLSVVRCPRLATDH